MRFNLCSADSQYYGLAIDTSHQLLYLTDFHYGQIIEMKIDGSDSRFVLNNADTSPSAIVLDDTTDVRYTKAHCLALCADNLDNLSRQWHTIA